MQRVASSPDFDDQTGSVLEDIYSDPSVDFQFDLKGVHSDFGNVLQAMVKREVVKKVLKDKYNSVLRGGLKKLVSKGKGNIKSLSSDNLKQVLVSKKKQLEDKIQTPPFLRTSDKIAFTLGIVTLCLTEFILLRAPHLMSVWYTLLIFPLLALRYYFYYKAKYQYFMLDFCYFGQVLLLLFLYAMPTSSTMFQIVFALTNGPLAVGAVMWRNSLVFHDLDKLTSVFIHLFPPLVTFCIRWYPPTAHLEAVCGGAEVCNMSFFNAFVLSMSLYVVWQFLYLLQTEVIDKKKLELDSEIMTSARWMSRVKPHPIWVAMKKRGVSDSKASATLVGVQFLYTTLTILPVMPVYDYFSLHVLYLSGIFVACVWNGANFYFDVFTTTYSKRLKRFLKEVDKKEVEMQKKDDQKEEMERKSKSDDAQTMATKVEATSQTE
jgi:hypothetical protein